MQFSLYGFLKYLIKNGLSHPERQMWHIFDYISYVISDYLNPYTLNSFYNIVQYLLYTTFPVFLFHNGVILWCDKWKSLYYMLILVKSSTDFAWKRKSWSIKTCQLVQVLVDWYMSVRCGFSGNLMFPILLYNCIGHHIFKTEH